MSAAGLWLCSWSVVAGTCEFKCLYHELLCLLLGELLYTWSCCGWLEGYSG